MTHVTPIRARRQLVASAAMLADLTHRLPVAIGHALDVAEGVTPSNTEDAPGIRRRGWISDPTGQRATSNVQGRSTLLDDVEQHLATLGLALGLLGRFVDLYAPREVERRRCGDFSPSDIRQHPAFDSLCGSIAESDMGADGRPRWRSSGLCSSCRLRMARHDRQIGAA